ncbi:MAG: hypothetical protein JNM00_05000, partial [Flavobacteriales bacterium]|nr:hypothetical protein [Flavobacteriales bacterium]
MNQTSHQPQSKAASLGDIVEHNINRYWDLTCRIEWLEHAVQKRHQATLKEFRQLFSGEIKVPIERGGFVRAVALLRRTRLERDSISLND